MLYRRYNGKYFEIFAFEKDKKKPKTNANLTNPFVKEGEKDSSKPLRLSKSQVQSESSLYVFNLTAH